MFPGWRTRSTSLRKICVWLICRLADSQIRASDNTGGADAPLQVLTGHCNLQKHRCTMGHDVSSTCPKCNLEEETPNHHVGECTYYQVLRKKVFRKEKNTIKSVVEKLNINLLAKYLQQTGRLAEFGQ